MASDVKWIKIATDIFDDEKIRLIEAEPEAYGIITCWFKLLCLAGKLNNSGVFTIANKSFTVKMLATVFRMEEEIVKLSIDTFANFGMVEIVDNVITIPNWGKHQNFVKIERKTEYMRKYMEDYRKKQKQLASETDSSSKSVNACKTNSKTISKANVSEADKDKELRLRNNNNYMSVLAFLNETCKTRFRMTEKTRRTIHARFEEGFTLEDFKTVIQKKFTEWNGTEFEKYLRPETLFGTKFERYLLEEERTNTNEQTEPDSFDAERLGTWL